MIGNHVHICESGPRDGLQLVRAVMPTKDKIRWIQALAAAGFPEIDATSFVPPSVFPQFADATEVVDAALHTSKIWRVSALAPNLKGAERAIAAGAQAVTAIVSASEAHSLANTRRSRVDQGKLVGEIVAYARLVRDRYVHIGGGIPTAFGCSLEGRVSEVDVCMVAEALAKAGVDEIGLADTVGYADPQLVRAIVRAVRHAVGEAMPIRLHFHNTMGLGLANVLAGLEMGVRIFDAACGGLGGCPFAPGASGNISTEDLVFMLEQMGLKTGINLAKLLEATDILARCLPDERIRSHLQEAGIPRVYGVTA